MRFFVFIVMYIVFFLGCSQKEFKVLDLNDSSIKDLHELPQDPKAYLQRFKDRNDLYPSQKLYKEKYYRIWKKPPSIALDEVMWPHRVFTCKKAYYGVNLKRVECTFYDKMLQKANFDHYMEVSKKALNIHAVNLRAFPTDKVLLRDPTIAGEGFPFDYLQNSLISPEKPLFVSHYSTDKEWLFVFSSFGSGWVKSEDIVFIDDEDAKVWMDAKQVYVYQDQKTIQDNTGFLLRLRVGMMLPLIEEEKENYKVLIASKKSITSPIYKIITLSKRYASIKPLLFTQENILSVLNQIRHSKYGWGGMYEQRDCSATMRDFFAPFGIWLPRNSSLQAKVGKVYSVLGLNDEEKLNLIKQKAIPFETMLYRKGHIVLYAGLFHDKIMVFQNLWGIKTTNGEKTGRVVIGKSVFSTLKMGQEVPFYDTSSSFLKKMESFNLPVKQ